MTNFLFFLELLTVVVPCFVLADDMREESLALERKVMENRLKMERFEIIINFVSGTENKRENYDCIRFHYFCPCHSFDLFGNNSFSHQRRNSGLT
ncbi:MAG: hypothetical protein LBC02_12585 [Planctomycetaceae bacterium]|jgi:hypothetical protein|nr:hypothetical protein [Planctomycetaceae bacterium]